MVREEKGNLRVTSPFVLGSNPPPANLTPDLNKKLPNMQGQAIDLLILSANSPVVAGEIYKLKSQSGKSILAAGSCQLVDMLIQNQLVDEYPRRAHVNLKSL